MDKLGIEPSLLAAQIVNFLIIVFVLQKLLFKPILDMIEKRKKEIAEGVSLTEKMRTADEALTIKQEKALNKAREDAVGIIEEAKKQAKDVEKGLIAEAHDQARTIIERAKAEAEETKDAAMESIRREAVELAGAMASKLLDSVLGAKEQQAILGKRMKDLDAWAAREAKKRS